MNIKRLQNNFSLNKIYLTLLIPSIVLFIKQQIVFPSDEVLLYRTLLSGDPVLMSLDKFWPFYSVSSTRIEPVPGIWLNIILGISSKPSQESIFFLQAALFYIHLFWIYRCLELSVSSKFIAIITTLAYAFSGPTLYVWQRPLLAESYMLFFLSALMFSLTKQIKSRDIILLISSLLITILFIFTKSSSFVIAFSLGSGLLIISIVNDEFKKKYTNTSVGVVIVSLLFFALLIIGEKTNSIELITDASLIKWFQLYLASDPLGVVILLLSPFVALLIFLKNQSLTDRLISIFFISGGVYLLMLIVIGKHSIYYLAPLYLLSLPKFARFFEGIYLHKNKVKSFWILIFALVTILTLGFVNFISSGVLTYWYPLLALYPVLCTILFLLQSGSNSIANLIGPTFSRILTGHMIGIIFYYLTLPGITIFIEQKINGILFKDFSMEITKKIEFKNNEEGISKSLIGQTFANYECSASLMYAFFLSENLSFELNNEKIFQLAPIFNIDSKKDCDNAINNFKNWNYKFFPPTLNEYGITILEDSKFEFFIGPTTSDDSIRNFACKISKKNRFEYKKLNFFFEKLSLYLRRPYIKQGFFICEN